MNPWWTAVGKTTSCSVVSVVLHRAPCGAAVAYSQQLNLPRIHLCTCPPACLPALLTCHLRLVLLFCCCSSLPQCVQGAPMRRLKMRPGARAATATPSALVGPGPLQPLGGETRPQQQAEQQCCYEPIRRGTSHLGSPLNLTLCKEHPAGTSPSSMQTFVMLSCPQQ